MARPSLSEPLPETFVALAKLGVGLVVSLLEEGEAQELGLAEERGVCEGAGIVFFSFPITDRYFPSYLVLATHHEEGFHILSATNVEGINVRIVTAYRPSPDEWESDGRTRRTP